MGNVTRIIAELQFTKKKKKITEMIPNNFRSYDEI